MEGFPSPHVSMETPLKSTLVEEVVSLLSQGHRLPAFWCRHMIWPIACQPRLESSKSEVMRWFVQHIDPKSPNPAQDFPTDPPFPFIPGCSWGPLLVPSGFHHTLRNVQIVLFSRCLDMKNIARLLLCFFFGILSYTPSSHRPPAPSRLSSSSHSVEYWAV